MEDRVLGDYRLLKQIGQGSLGTVFLAEHRFMKKQYVLKVLPLGLASDKGFIKRFELDVSMLASLEHPNIVKIHNVSFVEASYFLVMDCVVDSIGETTNFNQYLLERGNSLSEEELLDFLRQIASALDYAHSKSRAGEVIVHRGLKLNNILIGRDQNDRKKVLLSDFGLSRIIGTGAVLSRTFKTMAEALSLDVIHTNEAPSIEAYPQPQDRDKLSLLHQSFLQNFAFLAPEQKFIQNADKVGPSSDVYAFGILIYYAITRKFPEGVFEMPSLSSPGYRLNWDSLVCRCLQADPSKRPTSLVSSLDKYLNEKTSLLAPQRILVEKPFPKDQEQSRPSVSSNLEEKISTIKKEVKAVHETSNISNTVPSSAQSQYLQVAKVAQSVSELKPVINEGEITRPKYDPDPGAIFANDVQVTHYRPKPQEVKNVEPILNEMAVVQGGMFERGSFDGSRDEMPKHGIKIYGFAIDVHPVTNEQFVRFLDAMGGEKDAQNSDIIRLRESRIKRRGGELNTESGYAKHPVVGVTWYGAVAYAKWIGKRLPTEAEWEIAAKGNLDSTTYPTGKEIEKHQANYFSSDTTSVMSYPPNAYGLYDMAGNVYEWCQDWYGYNYYEASAQEPNYPQGPLQGVYRVLRGGCWKSLREDLRCTHRHRNNPGTENRTYGFRCAADTH